MIHTNLPVTMAARAVKTIGHMDPDRTEDLRRRLLEWGRKHRRSFPWRETLDPWRILLAEVLLCRTGAGQVLPVYLEMERRYPDPASLANESLRRLRKITSSLGLFWRVPLLREAARRIVRNHGGRVPEDRRTLMSLPGVGDYVAGAVRVLAFNRPDPALDANTVRVIGRVFGIPIREGSRRSRRFREAMSLLMTEHPREMLLAMIDLAAIICLPEDPLCGECPIRKLCRHGSERLRRTHGAACRASRRTGPGGPGPARRSP